MTMPVFAKSTPFYVTATGNIYVGQGILSSIFVSSASGSPSIAIYDDLATGTTTTLLATFTPTAGTAYQLNFEFNNGLYVVIANTVACTIGVVRGKPFNTL